MVNSGAAKQQGMGECRPAVILQRAKPWINRSIDVPDQIMIEAICQTHAAVNLTNKVVSTGGKTSGKV
ncbi:MAG: hypothetical protein WCS94_12520 [Verrucomicrobiota bacterium]